MTVAKKGPPCPPSHMVGPGGTRQADGPPAQTLKAVQLDLATLEACA